MSMTPSKIGMTPPHPGTFIREESWTSWASASPKPHAFSMCG
ncbi:MAG TPA: hypothetical protein VE690_08550 [Rhodopila sp.]|nr:hypothetical protein [Rhodopila sp.]